ncbi:PREDICTED: paternally-expressed gene 3 protein isoform X1 [Galeopterus variegatus]|uniref:Paternally-expressed gene 3 protein isoform X1 n=2 Tax=Galeopterus variegatus TaxID=482537 RepID=A0ABM0R426_GALVR|nr:PREDICTED: paternally-expressed gene 3 protein isoform X1 [Galeopterus variegatus]XP_008575368.1 PREDICTED: paternally-expressed gene 3 protein isoform X1 [Galeopterus variegatus]XP_008575369.1 PREDICTED: paternally-expressed gene 3 protein isoform X1 [Galeopterus variegatus]
MLPPKHLYATKPKKFWAPNLYELDSDLTKEPDVIIGEGPTDSEFFHQRFRNLTYVEFVGPRRTLIKLRNLCLDWLQPETRTKEEIIELLVLEQYLTIIPEKLKPWVQAKKPENCETLVTLLENYKEMYQPEDDTSSDVTSDDDMSRKGRETPPPRSVHSFSSDCDQDRDRDQDQDRDWDRRGRSRDVASRDRWSYTRNPRSRLPQRDLSLPAMAKPRFDVERDDNRDSVDYESRSQDAESYQNVVDLAEDRKPYNTIQDNMENYRKLLSLGVKLAEEDGHSHMTQAHSSRSKRSAYPSTSRGLKTVPEAKKSTHRRGICEDESSHGVIMEKFIKDVSRSSKSGRAREPNDQSLRFPRMSDNNWKGISFNKRESVIRERSYEGNATRGGKRLNSNLISRKKVLERKRRYHFDTDGQGSAHDQNGCARKKPFECSSEMRKAMSMSSLSSLSAPSFTESQPVDFGAMPYVCDECGRSFSVISEFVEHQIMHTRENLYEYGESFIHSVAVSEVQKNQGGGKRFECKECGETFNKSAALTEHRKIHAREYLMEYKEQECEETIMPSPTFSELQKIYGKDKFYECKVCKETFLHSSALIEHQKIHGRGNLNDDKDNERERERGEAFMPNSALNEFQKMYSKEKIYECKVCGETFLHSSSLKEHQKIHTRGNPFENKGKVREETFIPGQSLKRRQKTYTKEKLYSFKDGRDASRQSSDLNEHQKIHSQKHLFEARGYEKSVIRSVPFTESQKSHTITRPPENEEDEKAFTISFNPYENQKFPTKEKVHEGKSYERSVIHSLASAEAQKNHNAVGPSKLKMIAESTIQSSDVVNHQRSVIHSLAAPKPSDSQNGNELVEYNEKGESSPYISDLNDKRQKIPARENPLEEGKNNCEDSVIQSVSHTKLQKSLTGEGSGEIKQDTEFSVPSSDVRQYRKARAKKKYIEHRDNETSVIHSLAFGRQQSVHPREKLYECQECGASFAHSSDLTEHQKIHDREKPSGSRNYERSVICSLAPTDPQTSYAQQQYAEEQARNKCKEFGQCFATSQEVGAHQYIYAQEKSLGEESHGKEPHNEETHSEESRDEETHDEKTHDEKTHGKETHGEETVEDSVIQGGGMNEPQKDDPGDTIYECQDCGLGFVDLTDLTDHQKVHSRKCLVDSREYTHSVIHTHSISEYQREYTGEQLYECPKCGESFIHSSFLFEHQRIHEQDQLYSMKACDDGFIALLPMKPRRNRAAERNPALAGSAIRCLQCGQGFIHSSALNEHMRHHRDDELLEQSQMAEEAIIPGLALTEFERSQTEEKLFECTICGESFVSAAELGDHHIRIHKNEPYEYGSSYTHTSFLTEPLKGAIPFYECKDCGKSFIHNTILTKHKELHLEEEEEEEEAAAAQEVENNVLVPQEVLRIQGSNVEAAESEVEAAEPEVEAAEPEVEAAEPNGEAEGPDGEAAEPNGEAEQPNGEAEQPNGDADEPDGAGIEDPEERAEEPEGKAEEPEGDADEPDGAGIEDPEEEDEDQEIQVEEPYYECHECTETFTSRAAFGEHLKTHASMIIFEPANAFGECSGYIERASTSTGGTDHADEKYFKCDVCGQLFNDRLSLARHQNSHTG